MIRCLPRHLVDQIAAGEVVERPASVVKELVENALDAGATHVVVEVEEGGRKLIRVVDDGSGIELADLELAFTSHATSKLHELEDLEHIASLGFRGEALASIGAISRARIRSRARGAALGGEIEDLGGKLVGPRETGCPEGTTIEVRDLFFNTPARRKFLKRDSTELAHVTEACLRLALAHAHVGFTLRHGGREVIALPKDQDFHARVASAFGSGFLEQGLALEAQDGKVHLRAVLGKPADARRDARQYLFLNGRTIRDRALARAIKDAYAELIFGPVQPSYVVHLTMDPRDVDPNVHPTKIEVRFRDAGRLFGFLRRSIQARLQESEHASPGGRLLERKPPEGSGSIAPPSDASPAREVQGAFAFPDLGEPIARGVPDAVREGEAAAVVRPPSSRDDHPFLQVHDRYLVVQTERGFDVVDQHALHERVNYEAFRQDLHASGVGRQALLEPEVFETKPTTVAAVEARQADLLPLGVDLRPFGPRSVALFAMPARLVREDPRAFLERCLDELERAPAESPFEPELFLRDVLASRACRSSVMAGDPLRPEEIRALLDRAAGLENARTCPHGRPVRVAFTIDELDRAFRRK